MRSLHLCLVLKVLHCTVSWGIDRVLASASRTDSLWLSTESSADWYTEESTKSLLRTLAKSPPKSPLKSLPKSLLRSLLKSPLKSLAECLAYSFSSKVTPAHQKMFHVAFTNRLRSAKSNVHADDYE